jgi:hypothetical protein
MAAFLLLLYRVTPGQHESAGLRTVAFFECFVKRYFHNSKSFGKVWGTGQDMQRHE